MPFFVPSMGPGSSIYKPSSSKWPEESEGVKRARLQGITQMAKSLPPSLRAEVLGLDGQRETARTQWDSARDAKVDKEDQIITLKKQQTFGAKISHPDQVRQRGTQIEQLSSEVDSLRAAMEKFSDKMDDLGDSIRGKLGEFTKDKPELAKALNCSDIDDVLKSVRKVSKGLDGFDAK